MSGERIVASDNSEIVVATEDGVAVRTPRTWLETVLAVAILIEASRAMHNWYPTVRLIANGEVTTLGRLTWPLLSIAAGFSILRRPWLDRRMLDPLLVLTVTILSLSFLWSADTTKTLYQSIVFAGVAVCGAFLAIAFTRQGFVVLVSTTLGSICVVNVIAILAGINANDGNTSGFFEHKNILGLAAAVGLLATVARFAARERTFEVVAFTLVCASVLFLSGARTAQFGALFALTMIGYLVVRRHHQLLALALLAPALGVIGLFLRATKGFGTILTASGKSSDLTGRTEIWGEVTRLIGERPVIGWGYLSFWRDEGFNGGKSGFELFGLRHAHNGYLDAALGAGVLTGVLVAVTLLALIVRGYRHAAGSQAGSIDYALFAIALFTATVNISETLFPATTRTLLTLLVFAFSAGPMMRER